MASTNESAGELSKFFPEALQVLEQTNARAVMVLVVDSKERGNGAAPAFAVPNGADGMPDRAELARLQLQMANAMQFIADDLKKRARGLRGS